MRPIKMIALGLLLLPLAELAAFALVARSVGFAAAFLLLILASFMGIVVLRRTGSGAVTRLRTAAGNAKMTAVNLDGTDLASALGGILLVIPGFITGTLGLMVMFRPTRQWLMSGFGRLFSSNRRPSGPPIIDLEPDQWQRLPSPKLPPRKRRPRA